MRNSAAHQRSKFSDQPVEYSAAVIDHFERPRHVADRGSPATQIGRAGSEAAGAVIEFRLTAVSGRVEGLGFRAWGCPHSIAVASWLCETLQGRKLAELAIDLDEVAAALGLPAEKWHCVLIAEDALRAALRS